MWLFREKKTVFTHNTVVLTTWYIRYTIFDTLDADGTLVGPEGRNPGGTGHLGFGTGAVTFLAGTDDIGYDVRGLGWKVAAATSSCPWPSESSDCGNWG